MFTEVRFYSSPQQIIQLLSMNNINIEGYTFNMSTNDYRLVFADKNISSVVSLFKDLRMPYCLTPVKVISHLSQPGELLRTISNEDAYGSYVAESNRVIIRGNGNCNY